MIRRDRNIELIWQWKSLQMVNNGGWDSSLTIKDRGPGATWQALILMFYLPESGQESSEWSSLVDRHFILLRGQSLSLSKAFSWLCCCTCSSQNHIRGLGILGAKMSLLTLCAHPLPFPILPQKSSAPHCVSLTLTPVPLCRLVPFPLTAWLLYPLRLRSQITPPASLPWTTLSLSLSHTHTYRHTNTTRGDVPHLCSYSILGSPPQSKHHIRLQREVLDLTSPKFSSLLELGDYILLDLQYLGQGLP